MSISILDEFKQLIVQPPEIDEIDIVFDTSIHFVKEGSKFGIGFSLFSIILLSIKPKEMKIDINEYLLCSYALLCINPFNYTILNRRKTIIENNYEFIIHEIQTISSLQFHWPKVEELWVHKYWCIQKLLKTDRIDDIFLISQIKKAYIYTSSYSRNYYGWCFILKLLQLLSIPNLFDQLEISFQYTHNHITDLSAFNIRKLSRTSKLMSKVQMNPINYSQKSDTEYVHIRSKDNHDFVVPRSVLTDMSKTMANLLQHQPHPVESAITLNLFDQNVLEAALDYMHFRKRYANSSVPPVEYPNIEPEIILDVMLASLYLDC
ncbi:hypothetical protein WA158_007933 [Blastocystis sp. Blastoise]